MSKVTMCEVKSKEKTIKNKPKEKSIVVNNKKK